ncbi:hypothetical protein GIB67_022632, partial [Kingdonia uniflora]
GIWPRAIFSFERVGFRSNDQTTFLGFRPIRRKVVRMTSYVIQTTLAVVLLLMR